MITRHGVLSIDGVVRSVAILDVEGAYGENPILKVEVLGPVERPDISPLVRYMERKKGKSTFPIKKVIFNNPATIVMWNDGTKTVVKCQPGDEYNKELGLAMCICKKYFGNKGNYNEVFKKFIPEELPQELPFRNELIEKLHEYCAKTGCRNCIFNTKLGCKTFRLMTDDELRDAYVRVFCKKED